MRSRTSGDSSRGLSIVQMSDVEVGFFPVYTPFPYPYTTRWPHSSFH